MDSAALAQALRRIPLLSGLSAALLEEVARVTNVTELRRGAPVFADGDSADFLPILLSGTVKLYRADADGREQVLHLVRAPSSFAEAAVFGPGVFPAAAETIEPSLLARISRAELLALLRRRPEVALALLAAMSTWLRRLVDLIDGLALRTVEERVAAYLLSAFMRSGRRLVRGAELRLADPKHVIAALCGTAPEVLSRTFRKLEQGDVVRVDGPLVTLLDPAKLTSLGRAGEGF